MSRQRGSAALSLRGAKRRGNPFFWGGETDSHASDAVTGSE